MSFRNHRVLSHKWFTDPDTLPEWKCVEDFAEWYFENDMPWLPPNEIEVSCSDDATAMPIFRHGQFQVEIYMVHPHPSFKKHGHPGVDVIEHRMDRGGVWSSGVCLSGDTHGTDSNLFMDNIGWPLLAVEKWHDGIKPSTVAAYWKGNVVGQRHKNLINKHHNNPYFSGNYVDTGRKASNG